MTDKQNRPPKQVHKLYRVDLPGVDQKTKITFFSVWNGMEVFVAEKKHAGIEYVGYPTFILVDKTVPRFADVDETLSILGIHPVDAKSYKGESL